MRKINSTLLMAILFFPAFLLSQEEPLTEQIRSTIQKESFTVNSLIQAGFRFSLKDDQFQGGRTFEAANARLSVKGMLDNGFYYRIYFNLVNEPNLLDAYIGYQVSKAFRLTAGAMKPKQSLDYIPNPGSTDFIDRARITGLLVQSREIGLSAEGSINGLYYFTGIFNGNKHLTSNNNNKFYGIGRIQYSFQNIVPGFIQIAIQGSHGESGGTITGNSGPMLRGKRTIYGGDLRMETNKIILASEYMAGNLETEEFLDLTEEINGYYITTGYKAFKKTHFLLRWQSWAYVSRNIRNDQFTFGINHTFTSIASFQFSFDSYFPEVGEDKYGVSLLLQIMF